MNAIFDGEGLVCPEWSRLRREVDSGIEIHKGETKTDDKEVSGRLAPDVVVQYCLALNVPCRAIDCHRRIAGIVTDPTGAVVTGATLNLTNPATGANFTATSSASGALCVCPAKAGPIHAQGVERRFQVHHAIRHRPAGHHRHRQCRALEVGSSSTTVEVSAENGTQLQTENANISTSYAIKQIQEVPNPGGDVTYVAQTAPGVTMNNATGGGYGNFSTFGLPATSNLFTINGNDYNDPFLNLNNSGASNLLLGGNELQEVAVTNNAYTGQYGRQAGSQDRLHHQVRHQFVARRCGLQLDGTLPQRQ